VSANTLSRTSTNSSLEISTSNTDSISEIGGNVVDDESSTCSTSVSFVSSCGFVVFVGGSVSSGAGSTLGAGTVVSGMVVWSGSTGSLSCSAGSSTGPGR